MSLVNQVLSDLEKRGVNALPGEASIRVAPVQSNRFRAVWLMVAVLALVFVAAGFWWRSSKSNKTAAHIDANPAPVLAGSKLPALGTPLAGVSMVQAPARPVAVPQAESQPVAVATQEIHQEENRQKGGGEAVGAAMRLSFELSSIPLPSSLRAKSVAAATVQSHDKAALPEHITSADGDFSAGVRSDTSAAAARGGFAGDLHPAEGRAKSSPPVGASVSAVVPAGSVDKKIKQISVQQQADNEFRRASGLMQQGRTNEAIAGYEAALQLDAGHDAARQAMLGLLLENKRNADAERVLQDGLKHNPRHSGFAMLLARLQVERNELALALDTLQKTLPYAYQQADYQAFIAALMQRQNRHNEAISRYQIALQLAPDNGIWLMGYGISLQAAQRIDDARNAFRRALESKTLSPELQAFVQEKLKGL